MGEAGALVVRVERCLTNDYQVPQFWYNALRWVGGDRACFDIADASIVK